MPANKLPLVSIVIPAYNAAGYIAATVDSARAQDYKPKEIIVVDDGSTDATAAICARYGRRIKYIKQKNAGPGAARNRGIEAARGELIAFLDADDAWLPGKLTRQVRLMRAKPRPGLSFTDFLFEREPDQPPVRAFSLSPQLYDHPRRPVVNKAFVAENLLFEPLLLRNYIGTSTVVAYKQCLVDAGLFDPTLPSAQDRELWLRVAKKYRMAYIDEPLTEYHYNPNSITRASQKRLINIILLLERHYGDAGAATRAKVELELSQLYQDLGYLHFENGRLGQARRAYRSAMRYHWRPAQTLYWLASLIPAGWVGTLRNWKQRMQR